MPRGRDERSTIAVRPERRTTENEPPAFINSALPVLRSMRRMSRVAMVSSAELTIRAALTASNAVSSLKPDFSSRAMSDEVITESSAAREPVPIPSLNTQQKFPLLSRNSSHESPQSVSPSLFR